MALVRSLVSSGNSGGWAFRSSTSPIWWTLGDVFHCLGFIFQRSAVPDNISLGSEHVDSRPFLSNRFCGTRESSISDLAILRHIQSSAVVVATWHRGKRKTGTQVLFLMFRMPVRYKFLAVSLSLIILISLAGLGGFGLRSSASTETRARASGTSSGFHSIADYCEYCRSLCRRNLRLSDKGHFTAHSHRRLQSP